MPSSVRLTGVGWDAIPEPRLAHVRVHDAMDTSRPWCIVTTVGSDEHAAQLMAEHGRDEVIMADATSGHPVGIIFRLDIAAVYGA